MRISNLAQALQSQSSILNIQSGIAKARDQITTGKLASVFSGLKGENARLSVQLREAIATKESLLDTVQQTAVRMEVIDDVLLRVQELAVELRVQLLEQVDGLLPSSAPALKVFADNAIDRMVGLLNTKVGGRFVMSGGAVTTQSVLTASTIKTNAFAAIPALTAINATTVQGAAATFFSTDANWYSGGGTPTGQARTFKVNIDTGVNLEYGEAASDSQSFEEIFEVLAAFADLDFAPGLETSFRSMVTWGLGKVEAAFDVLNLQIARLGVTHARMNQIEEEHRDDLAVLATQLGEIENVDTAEAITRFQILQSQLETSFQVSASLRGLNLARFL